MVETRYSTPAFANGGGGGIERGGELREKLVVEMVEGVKGGGVVRGGVEEELASLNSL